MHEGELFDFKLTHWSVFEQESLYSVNTPLRASKIENSENTCVTTTRINTMDAFVFY
jgi:hypothetical protein